MVKDEKRLENNNNKLGLVQYKLILYVFMFTFDRCSMSACIT